MNIKTTLSILFCLCIQSVFSNKHCITHHGNSKEDINICIHGKPIDIHIEGSNGSPVQPVINMSINVTNCII